MPMLLWNRVRIYDRLNVRDQIDEQAVHWQIYPKQNMSKIYEPVSRLAGIIWLCGAASMMDCHVFVEPEA